VGSRSKIDLAYIAGFLDGDGSLMLQIKKRSDNGRSRFMVTICFYQDTRHEKPLHWIRKRIGIGYLSRRNDGITELRINGYNKAKNILEDLKPFIKFKKIQCQEILKSIKILKKKTLAKKDYSKLVDCVIKIQSENYATRKKRTRKELLKILELTP
jgi:hypothetical protein